MSASENQIIVYQLNETVRLDVHLLRGYSVNARLSQLEDKVDRRLAKHERDIIELKNKVDFFVQTETPPLHGVFFDGQFLGRKCFGFTKMDAGEIERIKRAAFGTA